MKINKFRIDLFEFLIAILWIVFFALLITWLSIDCPVPEFITSLIQWFHELPRYVKVFCIMFFILTFVGFTAGFFGECHDGE